MQVPYILCGDFNVEPHYPFYKLLSTGTLDAKDIDNLASYDYVNQYPGTTLPDKVSTHAMVHACIGFDVLMSLQSNVLTHAVRSK